MNGPKGTTPVGGLIGLAHQDVLTVPWASCLSTYLKLCPNMLLYWETIGAAGEPPRDDSMTFATVGIVLTAVAWFVTPAIVAAVFYLSR